MSHKNALVVGLAIGLLGLLALVWTSGDDGVEGLLAPERSGSRSTPRPAELHPASAGADSRGASRTRGARTPGAREVVESSPAGGESGLSFRAPEPTVAAPAASPAPEPEGCVLRGTLFGPDGAPVPTHGARVEAMDGEGHVLHSLVQEGRFAIEGLGPGGWWVSAWLGSREVAQEIHVTQGQTEYGLDLTLPPARVVDVFVRTVQGREFGSEARRLHIRAATSLFAVATREPPGARIPAPERAEAPDSPALGVLGRVPAPHRRLVPDQPWGRFMLEETGPLHVSLVLHEAVVATEFVPADDTAVTLFVDPASLGDWLGKVRFRLMDAATGAPVSKGLALVTTGSSISAVTPDEAGACVAEDCSPGLADIQIECEGYESARREVELAPGDDVDLGAIALELATTVSGRVKTARSLRGVSLHVGRPDWETGRVHLDDRVGRSLQGERDFTLGLGPGLWVLRAVDRYRGTEVFSANYVADLSDGPVEGLVIELRDPVRVLLRPELGDWSGVGYAVLDALGLEQAAGTLAGSRPEPVDLPPGEYTLRVGPPDAPRVETVFRAYGESLELPLR